MARHQNRSSFIGRRLVEDRRGSVAVLFALSLLPVIFAAGAALDYARLTALATHLQRATDATSLQLCQMSGTPTQSQMQSAAIADLQSYMGAVAVSVNSLNYTTFPRSTTLVAGSVYTSSFVGGLNGALRSIPVTATASCVSQLQTYEIALVLDNTGSMANSAGGQSKMDALKAAATNFVNSVFASATMGPNTKISLVPFATGVAVNPNTYRSASWLDSNGASSYHWAFIQGGASTASAYRSYGINSRLDVYNYLSGSIASWGWTGCFESLPYPLNVQDGKPTPSNPNSYYVPTMAPDESGAGGQYSHASGSTTVYSANSYIDDTNGNCAPTTNEATLTGQVCKYMTITNPKTSNGYYVTGPNFSCTSRSLTRLTTAQATLTNEISLMQPNGNTNIHEGFEWGWRTVSPSSVFSDGAPYTQQYNNKIVILMTDGMNTWSSNASNPTLKSLYSAYGFFQNPDGTNVNSRLSPVNANPTTDAQARAAIDQLTVEACQNARAAGVIIYTIGFSVSSDPIDQQGLSLLQTCAGTSDHAFVATDSSTINAVFQQIASSIGQLRLTR